MASDSVTIPFCSKPCGCGEVKASCEDHGYSDTCSQTSTKVNVCIGDDSGGPCEKQPCYDCPCKYSDWQPPSSDICDCLFSITQTRELLEGNSQKCQGPFQQTAQGTKQTQWSEWFFDPNTRDVCEGESFQQKKWKESTNCGSYKCYEEIYQEATGTKASVWVPVEDWKPPTSSVCEGDSLTQNADHKDTTGCKSNENRTQTAQGTKDCNNGSEGCWKATSMTYSKTGNPTCTSTLSGSASNTCRFGTPRDVADQESGSMSVSCPPGDYCEGRIGSATTVPGDLSFQGVTGGGPNDTSAEAKYAFEDCNLNDFDGTVTITLARCDPSACN